MAAPAAPPGAAPGPNGRHARRDDTGEHPAPPRRSRRRLATTPLRRVPWPVAADPDAVTVTFAGEPRHHPPEAPATTTVLPGSPAAPTAQAGVPGLRAAPGPPGPPPAPAPAPAPPAGPQRLVSPPTVPPPGPPAGVPAPAPGPAGPPPRRAPIHRDRVPGTPVVESRPVWGPPQPAR